LAHGFRRFGYRTHGMRGVDLNQLLEDLMEEFTILRGQRTVGHRATDSTHRQGSYTELKEFVHRQPFA
jgi:hypothetical protein